MTRFASSLVFDGDDEIVVVVEIADDLEADSVEKPERDHSNDMKNN